MHNVHDGVHLQHTYKGISLDLPAIIMSLLQQFWNDRKL